MLSNREQSFYDKIITEHEISTLDGLIPVEFPGTHIIVPIRYSVKSFFRLKHYCG